MVVVVDWRREGKERRGGEGERIRQKRGKRGEKRTEEERIKGRGEEEKVGGEKGGEMMRGERNEKER